MTTGGYVYIDEISLVRLKQTATGPFARPRYLACITPNIGAPNRNYGGGGRRSLGTSGVILADWLLIAANVHHPCTHSLTWHLL